MTRRNFSAALAASALGASSASAAPKTAMGVGSASYYYRSGHDRRAGSTPLTETLSFVEYCRSLGAGGVQVSLADTSSGYTGKVRRTCEEAGMYFEASARLPRSDSDIDEFRDLIKAAENAGAKVIRTVLFPGRRYEEHDSMETYREAKRRAWEMVTRAEPHLRKRRMKIAIENHKNLRTPDLLGMMNRIQSEYVGITFDFGNNYVLMEDPVEMAQALGKYAYSSHIKDHVLQEYEDGLLLHDAVLGTGVIDLPKVIRLLRQGNPDIKFTLETMSRDALKVPYLTERYWATFARGELPGRDLAMTLRTVRDTQPKEPLPLFSKLSEEEKLRTEDENVRKGLAYARDRLEL